MNVKTRLEKIEDKVFDDGRFLTAEDVELFLVGLPPEYAATVRKKITEIAKEPPEEPVEPRRVSLAEKKAILESMLVYVTPDVADKIRRQVAARGYR